MKDETNIEKLATLSHISISPEEQKELKADIDSILSYIEQIQNISLEHIKEAEPQVGELYNVMREDAEPHETGIYTKELLNEAPSVKDSYIEVKKIIDQNT
ncbi:Asp-tRNA(Asn)/Glu-tRNA(Gln) amidotransferase subunit GatC [Candidatus Kaiserbacteria bacterium]|nr:Asp-tRNA(Asn)/Glu-tRNA(Gln) amidotransferase subunit GatC [Candidatus Kaiserbacteria bacterium]